MGRPKKFDRDAAVGRAMSVFQEKGFVGATTKDLLVAMGIGRQSLYDTFGDKRSLFLEAFTRYCRQRCDVHIQRLNSESNAVLAIKEMFLGIAADIKAEPAIGYLEVDVIAEFGCDSEVAACRVESTDRLYSEIMKLVSIGRIIGEVRKDAESFPAADFLVVMMHGFQSAARAGMGAEALSRAARYIELALSPQIETRRLTPATTPDRPVQNPPTSGVPGGADYWHTAFNARLAD